MSDDDPGRDGPPEPADPARWMPPDPATAGEQPETRVLPTIGGAPGGGVVPGDPARAPDPAAASPTPDDAPPAEGGAGTIYRTPLADDAGPVADEAPARKRRGLLPRKRSRTDAATPEAPAAGDAPSASPAPADTAPARTPRRTRTGRSRHTASDAPPVSTGEEILDPKGRPATPSALRRERKAIIERRQAAVYHLGGLAFELYRRDMLGEEVMRLRARRLAEMDERVRRIDEVLGDRVRGRRTRGAAAPAGPAGCCLACRAPFDEGARFCSNCGTRLLPGESPVDDDRPTGPIVGGAAA